MNKTTLAILTTVIALPSIYALAQSQNTQTSNPTNSNTATVNDSNLIQQIGQANYQTQINHNDYSIPTADTTIGDSINPATTL